MNRAILFRYHDHLEICTNRVALLRKLNPGMPIWGMYGGAVRQQAWDIGLDADYDVSFPDPAFKWQHGDLCVREWFKERGHALPFDMLHVIEWDLILRAPVAELLDHVQDGIALSNLETLTHHRAHGWGWITHPARAKQFDELSALIRQRHNVTLNPDTLRAGPFGGASFSRAFLERYASEDIPLLCHDEIRLPAFAAAYGMTVHETGFARNNPFWNCEKAYYPVLEVLASDLKIFHPVNELIDLSKIK